MSGFTKQPLEKKKNKQNVLDRIVRVERKVLASPSATVAALSEISRDLGSAGQGVNQLMVRGNTITNRTLNYYLVYSTTETQMAPDVSIPSGGVSQANIVRVVIVGKVYNNSGGTINITPKIYIGESGSETQAASGTAIAVATGTADKGFVYSFTVQGSPSGGTNVIVDEKFEISTASNLVYSTTTSIGTISSLSSINNLYITFTLNTAHAAVKLWTNNIVAEILEGTQDTQTEYRFFSTTFEDTYINDSAPTTNYGTATEIYVGEWNAGVNVARSLLRCTNLTNIPGGSIITAAVLYLYISADFATNSLTMELFEMLKNWTEAGATWLTYDGTNAYGVAGGQADVDYDSTVCAQISLSASEPVGKVIQINLNSAGIAVLQSVINGGTNYGFFVKGTTETNNMYQFVSSENATTYILPLLEVRYTI